MIDVILSSKILTIVLTVVLVGLIGANALGYISTEILVVCLGFFGFTDAIAFRDWLNSKGFITYVFAGLGILGTVSVLVGWITPDKMVLILTVFGGGAGLGLVNGIRKATKEETILKKAA